MSKTVYVAALYNGRPNLIEVPTKKETLKRFEIGAPLEHIIGNDTPNYLYNKNLPKIACDWAYTAQEALETLREITSENVQIKALALRKAKGEHGYVERFRLLDSEKGRQGNE